MPLPLHALQDPHTRGVGTALYRAPEQGVASRGGLSYDSKADMFSLGIILFEMCHRPFDTAMERIETIRALRDHKCLPGEFISAAPAYFQRLIQWMVDVSPANRPTAAEVRMSPLLESISTSSHTHVVSHARNSSPFVLSPTTCPLIAHEEPKNLQCVPVYNIDAPFAIIREFGTLIGLVSAGKSHTASGVERIRILSAEIPSLRECLHSLIHENAGAPGDTVCGPSHYVLLNSTVDNILDLVLFDKTCLRSALQ